MKTIGIVAHSAEGGALCFLTACRAGIQELGPHMHPTVVVSAIPMGLSMPAWESGDHETVARHLGKGVRQVADAGADFFVCPDNTAHIVLEKILEGLPLPGLHIADVVCREIGERGWGTVGLLGTEWTMTGDVYPRALRRDGIEWLVPDPETRRDLDAAIFDELCLGIFREATTQRFLGAIDELRARGAEAVILGCTEIPLIVSDDSAPVPVLDSTRLLARHAVREALDTGSDLPAGGWIGRSD